MTDEKPKPEIFRHKGFTFKHRKAYRNPVLMYEEGVLNPNYKRKLVSYVWTKKEDKNG